MKLTRLPLGASDTGGTAKAMDAARNETENVANAHAKTSQKIRDELEVPLSKFSNSLRDRRKVIQNSVEKIRRNKVVQEQNATKVKA